MREQFPDGFDCDGCLLNGVSTWAEDNTELFGKSKHPGVDATVMAVEGITGLKINYWAMVNLAGFRELVDAVGGVTLNVRSPIPVGGLGSDVTGYIDPGTRKLTGFETLWYARAREGSDDYSRMARQKCVMDAMLHQISPQVALRNFSKIAKASSEMISTNLPASEVDRFLALALKAKGQPISTLSLVPPLVDTWRTGHQADQGQGRRGDRPGRGRLQGSRHRGDGQGRDRHGPRTTRRARPGRAGCAGIRRLERHLGAGEVPQLGERARLDDPAGADDAHAVAQQLDLGEDVAREQHGRAGRPEAVDLLAGRRPP